MENGIALQAISLNILGMTNEEVYSTIFNQRWRKITIRLSSGDSVTTDHPDYLLMGTAWCSSAIR